MPPRREAGPPLSDSQAEWNAFAIRRLRASGYSLSLPPAPPPRADDQPSRRSPTTVPAWNSNGIFQSRGKQSSIQAWMDKVEADIRKMEGSASSSRPGEGEDVSDPSSRSDSESTDSPSWDDLVELVEAHRQFAVGEATDEPDAGRGKTPIAKRVDGEATRLVRVRIDSDKTLQPTTPQKRRSSTPSSASSSGSSDLDTPTRRLSSPSKRRFTRPSKVKAVPLVSLMLASALPKTVGSSLLGTVERILQQSPSLTFPDLVHLAKSLEENHQMLKIAQAQADASGRSFGSSFTTLARLVSPDPSRVAAPASTSPSRTNVNGAAFSAAKALNLISIPNDPVTVPIGPRPPAPRTTPSQSLLILTTPRTTCLQCSSPLTLRSAPAGPFNLVSPTSPPRPVLVASHTCTNERCKAIHTSDHVEVRHRGRSVWIWEDEWSFLKVGEKVWVDREFVRLFDKLLLKQRVSPGGYAAVWNDLHSGDRDDDAADSSSEGRAANEEGVEDLDNDDTDSNPPDSTTPFRLKSAHVWRSFVISSTIKAASTSHERPLVTPVRISTDRLVRFANQFVFRSTVSGTHVLEEHECGICTRTRRERWKGGPATDEERERGVKWAGSTQRELNQGGLVEDTVLDSSNKVSFAVCDGISIGHFLCAMPSCPNPPEKQTRTRRFCPTHVARHDLCGIVDCDRPRFSSHHDASSTTTNEACDQPNHQHRWIEFSKRRKVVVERGFRRSEPVPHNLNDLEGFRSDLEIKREASGDEEVGDEDDDESVGKVSTTMLEPRLTHTWSLRRASKLQLLVGSCGTPLAWTKFASSETPRLVLDFLADVHSTLVEDDKQTSNARFPSYIAYDRACDVLREATGSPWSTQPFSSPRKNKERSPSSPSSTPMRRVRSRPAPNLRPPPPLPLFLSNSRLIVTGFHQQGHHVEDDLCRYFCDSAPMDGQAPDLIVPFRREDEKYDRTSTRVFERALNTSAAEQLNSSLRGFTHLLQGMKSDNFDFVVECILRDKKRTKEKGRAVPS
ncbi:hypothetical protein JCM10212_002207 [Sporobolomyces blumeae]